jgi:hypothetical protein
MCNYRETMLITIAAVLAAASSICLLIFMKKAPERHPARQISAEHAPAKITRSFSLQLKAGFK